MVAQCFSFQSFPTTTIRQDPTMTNAYRIKSNIKGFLLFNLFLQFSILSAPLMSGCLKYPFPLLSSTLYLHFKTKSNITAFTRFSPSFQTGSNIVFELLTVPHTTLYFLPVLCVSYSPKNISP